MLNPAEYFDSCEFCELRPTHIRASNGVNPIGGFDEQGAPRTEEELHTWLQSLLVTETPWPDGLTVTCDEHLYFRWRADGGAELSPTGRTVQSRTVTRQNPARIFKGSLREQAIEGYGGKCTECDRTENLLIYKQPDTATLRFPGGAKLRGEEKYRRLIKLGFPVGWELRCPDHPLY